MHAILFTFRPEVSESEFIEKAGPRMGDVAGAPGLVMKAYMDESADRWAGFYLFDTEENASAYLEGNFCSWLTDSGLISNIDIRRFAVDDEASAKFGTPTVPLAKAAA